MRLPFAARRRAPCDITGTRPTIRTWTSPPRERLLRSRNRLGVFQGFREKYLGAYLNEFVFRWNRRRSYRSAFDRLVGIGVAVAPATRADIMAVAA